MAKEIITRVWDQKTQDFAFTQETTRSEMKTIDQEIKEYIKLIPSTRSESLRVRYEARVEELEQQLITMESELKNNKCPNIEEARDLALRFLGTPAETWKNALGELKTMIHGMIFESNPTYSLKEGFGTPHLTLPFLISEHVMAVQTNLVDPTGLEPATSSVQTRRSTR